MFYTHLNLKFNPINDNFKFPTLESAIDSPLQYRPKDWITDNGEVHWSIWKYFPVDILSDDFISWSKFIGIVPSHALLFYAPPNSKLVPHLDGGGADAWAFNWKIGGDINMSWYETTTIPTRECAYREEDIVREYTSTRLGNPTLVKIGIPHGAQNMSTDPAWILSLRLKTDLSYEKAKKRFLTSQFQ